MARTPTQRSAAGVLAVLAWLTTAALAIVTNYATQHELAWLTAHPTVVWIVLAALAIVGAVLAVRPDGAGRDRPRRRWLGRRHDVRLAHCLACGKKLLVTVRGEEDGAWRCLRCGQQSVASVDPSGRVTISTAGHGKVQYVQRTQLFGLLTKIYHSEVLERGEPSATARYNDRRDGPESTVISRSIDGMFKREFRATFIRGLLIDRWKRIAFWSSVGTFLVSLGQAHGPLQFGWHLALSFCICVVFGVSQLWLRGWRTFGHWARSKETRYCWLQRSEGIALAILLAIDDEWFFEAIRIIGGRRAQKLGVKLMQDICRYADRNDMILSLNASDFQWLIDELRFERAPRQRRRGYTSLVRRPSNKHPTSSPQ